MEREDIRRAAAELKDVLILRVGTLADELLGLPEAGTEEWVRLQRRPEAERRADARQWHLVKMAIETEVGIDPVGDIVNARRAGATWEQVGEACGITRQAAHERWAHRVAAAVSTDRQAGETWEPAPDLEGG